MTAQHTKHTNHTAPNSTPKNNPSKHATPNQHQDSHNTKETYTNNSAPGKTQPTYESNKNASPSTTQ